MGLGKTNFCTVKILFFRPNFRPPGQNAEKNTIGVRAVRIRRDAREVSPISVEKKNTQGKRRCERRENKAFQKRKTRRGAGGPRGKISKPPSLKVGERGKTKGLK